MLWYHFVAQNHGCTVVMGNCMGMYVTSYCLDESMALSDGANLVEAIHGNPSAE